MLFNNQYCNARFNKKVYNKIALSKIAKGNFFLQKLLAVDLKHEPGDEKNGILMCK